MPILEPHQNRQMAESFGVDAVRYDRTRPAYPAEMIARIVELSPGPAVLDVGCGTGIAARQFRAAGCVVLGVEPDPRMAAYAESTGITAEVATFESWDAGERRFDAVVAGTAWHWIDPLAGARKAADVLRPGGVLAPFGHAFEPPAEIGRASVAVIRRIAPQLPVPPPDVSVLDGYQGMYAKFAEVAGQTGRFGEPKPFRFDWERAYTRDEWLAQLPTSGGLTRLAPEQLAEVLAATGAAIDELGGTFTMRYATVGFTAVRD
ncbi:MAG: class I SAM-dependent methyltransferase [Hamadaea sp.]|uniref:class I SAM-dependent methyltransferase n=1 Tax=Hamadaea sp. TaxID=2024425 RepID=UPI0017CB7110|nr:class I SAM-dependent methyltransferase [Hamadaea sp.]NUR71742.1 class I SAM-dependent methyltransferase [Hamadaea sp.]NUT19056.1 class I SAM-dependent methyltransferase [Hamadaea sp.]